MQPHLLDLGANARLSKREFRSLRKLYFFYKLERNFSINRGAKFGSVTMDDTNDADPVVETPANKKLKLLADIDVDLNQAIGSQTAESSYDQHQLILETSAYLGLVKSTNEKLSPLTF
jgi:hypothetical protein